MKQGGWAVGRLGGLVMLAALCFPTAEPPNRLTAASLTIGRLHYDGGGDWYANPSSGRPSRSPTANAS